MSDDSLAEGSAPNTDGIETWKLVLAVLLPLLCIAVGVCIFLYCRHRKQRARKTDVEQVGTMLQDLRTSQAEVDAMKEELQDGLKRVKTLETGANKRESAWARDDHNAVLNSPQANLHYPPALNMLRSGNPHDSITPTPIGFRSFSPVEPRPLSGSTLQGTLPRAAPGLQHTQYHSRARSVSHQSAESGETVVSYKPPSTIPEESTGNASSPFDTPGKKSTDRMADTDENESPSERGKRNLTRRLSVKAESLRRRASMLSIRTGLSPMRPNPSHPDLVPQPLAVSKRNSVRESYAETDSLSSRYGIDKTRLRRSASNPPANRSFISDSGMVTPTILAYQTGTTTPVEESTVRERDSGDGQPRTQKFPFPELPLPLPYCIITPPPTVEAMSVLHERRDGGNANNARPAKRNKNKKNKNKKQSHPSNPSTTSLSSSGGDSKKTVNKKKDNTVKMARNTPTPPPSGPPPPGSPPKRPLPVLPSRIPISSSHRRSLGASHKIGGKPQNPVLPSGTMGARKRSSLSSMRFSPSPSKRRSSFLLGVSSFSSPIRGGGGRASVLSSTVTPSPGQPRLPPSYASSQCLPSVDTMASLASATSSDSSADGTSGADTTDQTNNKPASKVQKQQVFTTPDNTTNNRGGQNGHRGHARLLSELSTTLRLVQEEEDAAAAEQAAASSAVSTRTAAAGGVSS
ncbi:hypothetical protein PG984_000456 [Apiospora sp. TS-2023a]